MLAPDPQLTSPQDPKAKSKFAANSWSDLDVPEQAAKYLSSTSSYLQLIKYEEAQAPLLSSAEIRADTDGDHWLSRVQVFLCEQLPLAFLQRNYFSKSKGPQQRVWNCLDQTLQWGSVLHCQERRALLRALLLGESSPTVGFSHRLLKCRWTKARNP